jgi:predicted transcriptional regulator
MKVPKLGQQEMEILNYIGDHTPISVRDVAAHFEREKGLARTTILTVMERLRKKGLLTRKQAEGSFQYSVKIEKERLLQEKVGEFIQRTLGGSVSPLINYFVDSPDLKPEELEQLKALVSKMEKRRE